MFETVTILGANGSMGCQIGALFASFGGAKVYMISRSLEKSLKAVDDAVASVRDEQIANNMVPGDYSMLEECLGMSGFIYESVAEDLVIKRQIIRTIGKYASKTAVIGTGTSGLSITDLAEELPEILRSRYMGTHFCNPPYVMPLCELVPTKYTDKEVYENVNAYMRDVLLRRPIKVMDSAAFLGNRIGMYCINEAMNLAATYADRGGIDYIDAILGGHTGRNMPPLVTADFVGLDVHRAIVDNIYDNTSDYAHDAFVMPHYVISLVKKGILGRKTGKGFYGRMEENGSRIRTVYDITDGMFRPQKKYKMPFAESMRELISVGRYDAAFKALAADESEEAAICIRFLLKYVLYSIHSALEVADSISDADIAMSEGFNWCPPMAMYRLLDVNGIKSLCEEFLDGEFLDSCNYEALLDRAEPCLLDHRRHFKG